ncbi:MAG: M81 family metallopeptidase [Ferrovibrio sp.]|uniref:M81 family metallopeptidase n=1 Tax=Ferrovibrio sp. TaxID=1917215 RepID=UPI002605251B|nr:M81 family metallopeptidase [Ferrovibrio sp.]MCW0232175.1 M81 family metallopeptidase [Ferrovibrio sp.]
MTVKKRLAVARLWHEGNSFSPLPTTLADFERREWFEGADHLARYRGTGTELGAVAAFIDTQPDWDVTVLRCASAPPGGPVEDALYERIVADMLRGLGEGPWDAVYLSLHGALVTVSEPQADLKLIRRVRAAIGTTPLGVSFDLHANIAPELVQCVDFASGYKTHPHVDMDKTAAIVLAELERLAGGGTKLHGAVKKIPALLHSFNMRTAAGPMADTVDEAKALCRDGVKDVTVFGGFVWGDSPDAGAGILSYAETAVQAAQVAEIMAAKLYARRAQFHAALPTPAQGLAQALATPGLVCVVEPSDNPLSGGIGDTTGLLHALLETGIDGEAVFAFLYDPALVQQAKAAGIGNRIAAKLGGRIAPHFGAPVAATVEVVALTDGRFINEGPFETGMAVDLGETAVLKTGSVKVIVTSSCQAGIDPAYFRLHGIDLATTRLIAAKAKNHFRAAFIDRAAVIVDVDTPGPAALDLAVLPFRHLPAGMEM